MNWLDDVYNWLDDVFNWLDDVYNWLDDVYNLITTGATVGRCVKKFGISKFH